MSFVMLHVANSLVIDLSEICESALFDSDIPDTHGRIHSTHRLEPGAVAVFHDTADQHVGSADAVFDLMNTRMLEGIFLPTPRGLFVGRVVKPHRPSQEDNTPAPG
jgi:hypothetical protein